MMKKTALAIAACLALISVPLRAAGGGAAGGAADGGAADAAEPGFALSSRVDWAAGTVDVEITRSLDPGTASLARAKGDAQTDIESHLSDFMLRAIAPLTVDSSHTFGDLLGADPALFARVNDLILDAPRDQLFLSPDFSSLVARYLLPLFGQHGVAAPFFPSRENPVQRRLGYVATRRFTGLLVYARGLLPEMGTTRTIAARPAVFPRFWDEEMNLVLDRSMCRPDALGRGGMVGYAQSLEDDVVALRAGPLPLRLAARGVFGEKATDLVLPTQGVRQLLSLPENITMLQECRIVIVYDSLK
jgi:hypothetical protein